MKAETIGGPRLHDADPTCWCTPKVFEPCMECDAFEDQHDPALHSAIAVLVPWPIGKTAARPKKSKDCWKCGGDGLLVPETPYPGCLVIHRPEGLVIEEMLAKVPKGPKKKRDRKAD